MLKMLNDKVLSQETDKSKEDEVNKLNLSLSTVVKDKAQLEAKVNKLSKENEDLKNKIENPDPEVADKEKAELENEVHNMKVENDKMKSINNGLKENVES